MKTTDNEHNKMLTIAQAAEKFGWTTQPIRTMVHLGENVRTDLPPRKGEDYGWRRNRYKEDRQLATRITLRDVLAGLTEKFFAVSCEYTRLRDSYRGVIARLADCGFNQLDSIALPAHTVSFEDLRAVPRKELLGHDAIVLGTLSFAELRTQSLVFIDRETGAEVINPTRREQQYCDLVPIRSKRLTVADILAMNPDRIRGDGAARTIVLLERLGFDSSDGPFMKKETDPKEELVKSLIAEDRLTKKEAVRFARIAARRNWI
ncbi:MAG: hypothetical protein ACYC75_00780 [Minisyncoccota bacterium]